MNYRIKNPQNKSLTYGQDVLLTAEETKETFSDSVG